MTPLRHGFSTAIASGKEGMLAPAATMKTVSHVPLVCCMVLAIGTSSAAVPLAV